ncbi:hypothetical protein BH11PLA2_BH11PLA2_18640 [soil metagenome]
MNTETVFNTLSNDTPQDGLVNRVKHFLEVHPEVVPEVFLRDALEHEVAVREVMTATPTPEEIQDHAWVEERLGKMRREQHEKGFRLRDLFLGHR